MVSRENWTHGGVNLLPGLLILNYTADETCSVTETGINRHLLSD